MDHERISVEQPLTSVDLQSNRRNFMKGMALLFTGSAAYALTPNFAYAEMHTPGLETLADVCLKLTNYHFSLILFFSQIYTLLC